ncbi:uncharacterized protein VTP21DRAFT_7934 [Calcarisporiella thermophila]|uniref:uncharacterized protein n=1 Tax=Calcarisporiella thermophila TaxID=911321 RepID=UPI003743305A
MPAPVTSSGDHSAEPSPSMLAPPTGLSHAASSSALSVAIHHGHHQHPQIETLQQKENETLRRAASATQLGGQRKKSVRDFEFGRTLGEGSYSTVVKAIDRETGREYAIKILDKRHILKEKKVKYVNIEKEALSRLHHPGVVQLYYTFQDQSSLYFVLEIARNGELLTLIKKRKTFSLPLAQFYAAQILSVIEYIHSKDILHRDVKPENVLLDDKMHIKMTDFGTAKILTEGRTEEVVANEGGNQRARSFVGTAEYVSPELLTEKSACKASDWWALGCIIYQMLAGRPPFKAPNEYQTFLKITNLEYDFPDGFPDVARDLVQKILILDPSQRLGSMEMGGPEKLKEHPFFSGVHWATLFLDPVPELLPVQDEDDLNEGTEEAEEGLFADIPVHEPDPFLPHRGAARGKKQRSLSPTGAGRRLEGLSEEEELEKGGRRGELLNGYSCAAAKQEETECRLNEKQGTGDGEGEEAEGDYSSEKEAVSKEAWRSYLLPKERVVRTGVLIQRKFLFSKKRFLVLTDHPRLLCLDTEKLNKKDEILGSGGIMPELKGRKHFCIRAMNKSYRFEDPQAKADEWVHAINRVLVDHSANWIN